ncbi:MAG: LysR family transcriptional regulator [Oscillospiraceae bacterium]|nr:LysR family transcriptional regulator [Oscillospiraceae bacterium]
MEFTQVKYFIVAAQTQNLTKASQVLNITQSALSKSISNLEQELGLRLFDRTGKKVLLNDSGRKFLRHALNSMHELDAAVSAAKSQDERQTLSIGMFHHSQNFMRCLAAFMDLYPDTAAQLDYLEISTFRIDTSEYDMLLFPESPMFRKYKSATIYSDPYFLAVHKSSPLSRLSEVALKDLRAQRLIFIKQADGRFDLPYHLCSGMGFFVRDDVFTNSYEVQRWLISINQGSGFIPSSSAEPYRNDGNIVLLPISDSGLSQDIKIGFKREKYISETGRKFAAFVRNHFGI